MAEMTPNQAKAVELYNQLWAHPDPETRKRVREHVKSVIPEIQLPTDEFEPVVAPLRDENKALRAAIEKLEKDNEERTKRESEAATFKSMESQVDAAVKEYSLTDEGRAKMLDRMKETGNYGDPAAAAAWVASKAPPAPPPNPLWAPQDMNLFGSKEKDENLASLHRNPEKYLDNQLMEFVRDPDRYVAETFGQ